MRTVAEEGERRFEAELDGDLRPLFEPQYRAFFGDLAMLEATAFLRPDGTTDLESLVVETGALALEGRAVIGSDGLPRLLDLEGTLAGPRRRAAHPPLSGPETRIDPRGFQPLPTGLPPAAGESWVGHTGRGG